MSHFLDSVKLLTILHDHMNTPGRSQIQQYRGCLWRRLPVSACGPELCWSCGPAIWTDARTLPLPGPPQQSQPRRKGHTPVTLQKDECLFMCRHMCLFLHIRAYLFFSLGFLHILSAYFDPRSEDGTSELQHIDAQQMAEFLSSCVIRHGRLVLVLLFHEGYVPKLEHSRDHLQHGWREVRQGGRSWFIARSEYGRHKLLFFPLYLLTYWFLGGEAHNSHGVHSLGEILCIALTRNRYGASAEKAILISGS